MLTTVPLNALREILSNVNDFAQVDGFDDYAAHVAGTNVVGYNCVAALALLLYDILLTAREEVRVIWPIPWNLTKCLFFFVRYFTLLLQISIMFVGTPPFRFTAHDCYIWNVYQGLSSVLIIASVDYILILRIFALYPRSPPIRAFVSLLYCAELVTMSVGIGLAVPKLEYDDYCTIVGAPDVFMVSAGAPIAFQSLLFAFTLVKFLRALKAGWGDVPIMQLLMRDGTWAFGVLFALLLSEAALYGFAPEAYTDVLYGWINTAFAISGYRILLNLHTLNRPSSPSASIPDTSPHIQFTSNLDTGGGFTTVGGSSSGYEHEGYESNVYECDRGEGMEDGRAGGSGREEGGSSGAEYEYEMGNLERRRRSVGVDRPD